MRTGHWVGKAALAVVLGLGAAGWSRGENWPAWRGPEGMGHCREHHLPLKWSPTESVRWKVPLPEPGNSTPIVWGDRVFLTQATDKGQKRSLWCLDRGTGKVLWRQTIEYRDRELTHNTNPFCSASPVTDGQRVVVSFGSAGLACYDFRGKRLWHRDLGPCRHIWGNAASPVLHGNLAFLNFGPGQRTFLLAVDKRTGRDVWKAEEPGGKTGDTGPKDWTGSWSTPLVANLRGRDELIMSWPGAVKSYAPETGQLLWTCRGLDKDKTTNALVYTSPLASPDAIVAMGGFGGARLAVRPGGSGDVTETHRLWRESPSPQRIGSGVIVGRHLFMVNAPGTFECIELATGKTLWTERVGGQTWASLLSAGERLYVTTLDGETLVLAAKPEFELLARNALDERTLASIAVSDGALFIRTYKHLWCIR